MEMKICAGCKKRKFLSEFNKQKKAKDNRSYWCKECKKKYNKKRRKRNKEKAKKQMKKYYENHKEEIQEYAKQYREEHKEEILRKKKKYYQSHKKEAKKYQQEHKKEIAGQKKKYREEPKKYFKEYMKKYKKTHKEEINKHLKERRNKDINFRMVNNLRSRISKALKRNTKSLSTMSLVGCGIEYLKYHLQCQFKQGMSWDNYGYYGWHRDEIIPCSGFDLSKASEQRNCFNYMNLQPLWTKEHRIKTTKELRIRKEKRR